jgi:hypothetical protein
LCCHSDYSTHRADVAFCTSICTWTTAVTSYAVPLSFRVVAPAAPTYSDLISEPLGSCTIVTGLPDAAEGIVGRRSGRASRPRQERFRLWAGDWGWGIRAASSKGAGSGRLPRCAAAQSKLPDFVKAFGSRWRMNN